MCDRRILVVDDDPLIRGVVAEALEFEGYLVTTAEDGAQALVILQVLLEKPCACPPIILLDMRMPNLDVGGSGAS